MSEVFQTQMILDPRSFEMLMTEVDYKHHIKQKLAYALAEKILESKRASFTYVKNPMDYTTTVIGRVTL